TYERVSDTKGVIRTFEANIVSRNDCLTVAGWHRKAIEICGGKNARVTETQCRARGAEICEYVCEWS
ncbi:MAG TPA: TIGR02265 family protein, partial [Thermoanaerobaculia bacterium]|nr:TIGR02265 family protein [Thermoanaerobaculia bacterium]